MAHTYGPRSRYVNLIGRNRCKDMQLLPGAGYRDIETLLAPVTVQRTKVHGQLARHIRTEGDRKQHDVAFVTLDILQVFDDYGFFTRILKKPFKSRIAASYLIKQVKDQRLLFAIERDYDKRQALVLWQI